MNNEEVAEQAAQGAISQLENLNNVEIIRFTPSIEVGKRYVGIKRLGQEFLIEITVTEV